MCLEALYRWLILDHRVMWRLLIYLLTWLWAVLLLALHVGLHHFLSLVLGTGKVIVSGGLNMHS